VASVQPYLSRVERAHRLIEELRARAPRPLSARLLAERLGVTVRTIERDVADLVAAGVPIRTLRGAAGGHRIDARTMLPPVELTPGEAAALVAALAAIGPRSSASAQTAMAKLVHALCEET
jgi:predicted DNA-binding transcriptional regulator YafY